MGCVEQAVLEFDEEVRAPWRPRLAAVPELPAHESLETMPAQVIRSHPSRRNPSRVGACRPHASRRRGARPSASPGRGVLGVAPTPGVLPAGVGTSPRLRLTRRGRHLGIVIALAAGVALGSWLAPLVNG